MDSTTRTCAQCGAGLPASSTKRRRYCDDQCRDRARKVRRRAGSGDRAAADLAAARERIVALETRLGQVRSRLADRKRTISELRARSRSRDRSVQAHARRAITARVGRIVDTRDRLAAVKAELEAVTAETGDRADSDRAAAMIADLQARLTAAGDRYDRLTADRQALDDRHAQLVTEHNRLAAVVRRLAADRSRFVTVRDQWDTLAGRLAKSAAEGRSLTSADRTIVTTWAEWKKTTAAVNAGQREKGDRS